MSSPSLAPSQPQEDNTYDNPTPSAVSAGPTPVSATSASPTASSSPALQPGALLTGGLSPPLIVGVIAIGALFVAAFAIYAWCRRVRGLPPDSFLGRYLPASFRRGRRPPQGGEGDGDGDGGGQLWGGRRGGRRRWVWQGQEREGPAEPGKAKPAMFNAWIERRRRSMDTLKWEAESVPFSATLLTTSGAAVGVTSMIGTEVTSTTVRGESVEEDEKLHLRDGTASTATAGTGSSSTLQVAVLLQMPSPRHTEAQNDTREELLGYQGELAIGIIEVPWTSEDCCSRERTTS